MNEQKRQRVVIRDAGLVVLAVGAAFLDAVASASPGDEFDLNWLTMDAGQTGGIPPGTKRQF